eukprot:g13753.t1
MSRWRNLSLGDVVEVYARRRNLEGGRISLNLTPESQPRLSIEDVASGTREHEGSVVSVQHGSAFVDIHCEVCGVLPATGGRHSLRESDRVLVRVDTWHLSETLQSA